MFSVAEPVTTVLGGPEMYINKGSTINLTCVVKHSPEPPPAIHWTHNQEEINYDSPRGGVSVITEKGDITVSYLLVQRANQPDSGKYTCSPSNANPKTIIVHVLDGWWPVFHTFCLLWNLFPSELVLIPVSFILHFVLFFSSPFLAMNNNVLT